MMMKTKNSSISGNSTTDAKTDHCLTNSKLCRLVEQYPCMYDRSHPHYLKKDVVEQAWMEIASEMNDSVSSCKERWRNVRTSYARSININKIPASANRTKPYYLHEELKFLSLHITPGIPIGRRPNQNMTINSSFNLNNMLMSQESQSSATVTPVKSGTSSVATTTPAMTTVTVTADNFKQNFKQNNNHRKSNGNFVLIGQHSQPYDKNNGSMKMGMLLEDGISDYNSEGVASLSSRGHFMSDQKLNHEQFDDDFADDDADEDEVGGDHDDGVGVDEEYLLGGEEDETYRIGGGADEDTIDMEMNAQRRLQHQQQRNQRQEQQRQLRKHRQQKVLQREQQRQSQQQQQQQQLAGRNTHNGVRKKRSLLEHNVNGDGMSFDFDGHTSTDSSMMNQHIPIDNYLTTEINESKHSSHFRQTQQANVDYDVMFLKGLLPEIRAMNNRQKIRFKCEVYKIVQHILSESSSTTQELPIVKRRCLRPKHTDHTKFNRSYLTTFNYRKSSNRTITLNNEATLEEPNAENTGAITKEEPISDANDSNIA